ncbi:TRAP transporter substrate-binding protein [Mesorhizobium sp. ES1-3]|uniref:TRAP transporter substrate-binding protein n=1 Tax=Mesorhizobium sp. ES1-3 TaxID=2876628 RepID=UPI001CCA6DB9|nr:TRAP transporter substrate-binding protein [Mesorhizobium sp. ES1-3]MBZ9668497.1 TRAP transporter substrate-binding protein [Mesorhizobium sp. ES1-3]
MFDTKISRRGVLATALGAGASITIVGRARAKTTLKLGHLANEQNSWHKASLKFAEEVANRTNGEIEIKVFPNEQLGKETDLIKGIQLGTVDFTITGESLQNWAPLAALLAVPYAIRDLDHMKAVIGGSVGQKIAAEIEDKTKLVPLTWFARGPRELTANKAIRTPDELAGLKLRVPNVPLFVSFWQALGAKPTPMAFSEVFTSLQSHVVDAQENPLALIQSASFFEVQKYLNKTDHVLSWIYLVGGSRKLGKLPDEQQKAIREAAAVAQEFERKLFLADEARIADELKAKGMEFIDVDKQAFATRGKDAVTASLGADLKPLYEDILATK